MARIEPVNSDTADQQTAEVLTAVKSKMGMVPNIISTMAQSPAVAKAYLEFSGALGGGSLSPRLREQLSLAVGEANSCGYCVSAHSALGKGAGLSDEDIVNARKGGSSDGKEDAALKFAVKLVEQRGMVSDADVDQLRTAGYTDGEIGETVGNVALNIFTNYFNEVAKTEIDFPVAPKLDVA